jgi:hypothetical protein
MKLLDYAHYADYGNEWYLQVLQCYPNFALLDACIQWDEYPSTEIFPMLLISFGSRALTGFTFRWKWFQVRCDFLTTAPCNLEYYRRGNYESID